MKSRSSSENDITINGTNSGLVRRSAKQISTINHIPAQPKNPLVAFHNLGKTLAFSATSGNAQLIPRSVNSILLCINGSTGIPYSGIGTK